MPWIHRVGIISYAEKSYGYECVLLKLAEFLMVPLACKIITIYVKLTFGNSYATRYNFELIKSLFVHVSLIRNAKIHGDPSCIFTG